jgi:hypothetical protein
MRNVVGVALAVCLLPVAARAGDAEEARALLDRAVQAMGGAKALSQQGFTCKTKGTLEVGGQKIELSGEWSAQAMNRYRWELEVQVEGRSRNGLLILDGDKGWLKGDTDKAQELPKEIGPFLRSEFRLVRLAQRLPGLTEKGVTLSPLGELKIDGKPALGLKVAQKGQPDVDLFFDKETLLPVRAEMRVKEPEGGEEKRHTFSFADYKDVGGVKQFTKVSLRRDDTPTIELELSDLKFHDALDDGVFAKP